MRDVGKRNKARSTVGQVASYSVVTGARVTQRKRLLVRRDPAAWPFVWRGLLPTLGLLLLTAYAVWPFARQEIEANVTRSITRALTDRGLTDVAVKVSGQHVLLSGSLKSGVSTVEALAIAQRATCPTWAGPQVCAELVIGAFESAPSLGLPAGPAPAAAKSSAPAPTAAERQACEKALAEVVNRQRIEFASGSAQLLPASSAALDAVAQAHAGCKGLVRIEGHTDDRGEITTNQTLSVDRANAVRNELVKRGIPGDRLVAEGYGPSRPVADNNTPEGRQQNRRIEFKVAVPN
jgi:outer membrane protein OmpA-like peptidoglycan-associated protein